MNVKNAVPQRFILLDGLRMLAALGVLSFHVVVITDYTQIDNLYVLVDFFFALSGFVLLPSMPGKLRSLPRDFSIFALKRALRLYPVVWVTIALSMGLYFYSQWDAQFSFYPSQPDPNRTTDLVVAALLLLQIWVGASMYMVVPLWSLSAEWFANLIFSPLTAIRWGIGILVGVVAGYVMLQYGLSNDLAWIEAIGPIREWEALGRAMIGFGLGLFVRYHFDFFSRFRHWSLLAVSLLGCAWVFQMPNTIGYDTTYFAAPIFAFFILQASKIDISSSSKTGKFTSWLGSLSFGVYAFHLVVITNIHFLLADPIKYSPDSIWAPFLVQKICLVAAISMALAWITRQAVERPIQKLSKRLPSVRNR